MNNRNVLLITVDDMSWDSLGCMGCRVPDITPNIDRLAEEGVLCENSYVAIAVCQPSRSALMTGRYPHKNGARGFEQIDFCVTTLTEHLREYGYYNGIIGKVPHLQPEEKFAWDYAAHTLTEEESWGRDPKRMYEHTKKFIRQAKEKKRPFFLMANSHDPHRPYAGSEFETPEFLSKSGKCTKRETDLNDGSYFRGKYVSARRYYKPEEIEVPGYLPNLPDVQREVADYYSSVHRADEAVGCILKALEEEGMSENTFIMFLSDNGAALPFAKTNCYLHGTRSPFIVRLPGVIPSGKRTKALISSIDYTPTVLDFLEIEQIAGVDGKSLRNVLEHDVPHQYDTVFTSFFKTAKNASTGKERHYPMRCVQGVKYAYIFNAWAGNGEKFLNESTSGLTFPAMQIAAETDETIKSRVDFFLYRIPEEFYDIEKDPNCLYNLMDAPSYQGLIISYRKKMHQYMEHTQGGLLDIFKKKVMDANRLLS